MQGWLAQHHGWRAGFARNLLEFFRGVQTIRSFGDVAAAVFIPRFTGDWWRLFISW